MAAYVRKKRVGPHEYYQLVESRRVASKPRQKVLVHLGMRPTVDDALDKWSREIEELRRNATRERENAETWPEKSHRHLSALRRANSVEKRAKGLESRLQKLRDLRKQGVV